MWTSWKSLLGCALAPWLLLGCSTEAEPAQTPSVSLPAPSPPARPIAYRKHAFPGPWWREASTRRDFEAAVRTCRVESTAARRTASGDHDNDAAYRGFIDCMGRLAWTRGFPPSPTAKVETGTSGTPEG